MFNKLKQAVGMVGVKVELEIPAELPLTTTTLEGTIHIESKQDQHITSVKVSMKQIHHEGSGQEKTSREFEIGEIVVTSTPFDIKAGETKDLTFALPFSRKKTNDQKLSEKGGVLGALGKISKSMDNEKDNFWVTAMADVKGAMIDPNDTKQVRLN